MKKIFTLIALAVTFSFAANAQAPTHKFTVNLYSPGGETFTNGQNSQVNDSLVITIDQGALLPTDTVAYGSPTTINAQNNPVVYLFGGYTKNVGDTIIISATNGVVLNAAPGMLTYCAEAFLFDRSATNLTAANFDTTNSTSCVSITVVGNPASVSDVVFRKSSTNNKLLISPNPAVSDIVSFDFVALNTSDVNAVVYDLTGRKVMSYNYGRATKGKGGYSLDISQLNKGMYIVELTQDNMRATGRMLK